MTAHFELREFTDSETAVRLGIDNTPPPAIANVLLYTMGAMEQVRAVLGFPVRVNSGYRCEALEKVLTQKDFQAWCRRRGLTPNAPAWAMYFAGKAHPRGYAVDFTCAGFGSPARIVRHLRDAPLRFDQLIEEGTWVHASFDPRMRGQVLVATFNAKGEPSYSEAPET